MDGLSVLYALSPAFDAELYKQGNAHGWLSKSAAVASHYLAGRLYMAKSGWLLLAVPNALVRGVFDAMTDAGVELPLAGVLNVPNVDKELLNAHISVMTAEEAAKIGAGNINERGQSFKYSLGPVKELAPKNIDGVSKLWAIQVSSPELSALRKSYGLSALPKDEPFHITVAVRRTGVLRENAVSKGYEMSAQTSNEPTFRNPTSRGSLKAAADNETTYECNCSGRCTCPDTCVCKKSCCVESKAAAVDPSQVILVSGHSGAGKTTLSKALADKLKLPLYAVDDHPDQKAFFAANKDGQETVVGSPAYNEFQKLRQRTAAETLAKVDGPAIVEGAQLAVLPADQLAAYKNRIYVHTPLQQLLKQRLARQQRKYLEKGKEWTPEIAAKKQQIGRAVYDVQNKLMRQYSAVPETLKYNTRKDQVDAIIARLTKSSAELSRSGQKDLLPGGKADNVPGREFSPKELAIGAADEHEHTDNDQVAREIAKDHLQEDPQYYEKEKLIQKEAQPAIILKLREAKEHSDNKRYDKKNEILRRLMTQAPDEWFVDDPLPRHMGITHAPTSFRFHADPGIIPVGVKVKAKAASSNPYWDQIMNFSEAPVIDKSKSIWQNFFGALKNRVSNADRQYDMQQNDHKWRAELIPGYREQMNMAIARGEFPKPNPTAEFLRNTATPALNAVS
jgi:shikimate kinase